MSWRAVPHRAFVCAAAAGLFGCGDDLVLPNRPDAEDRQPRLAVVSGDDQEGQVGAPLPELVVLRVVAQDDGSPIAGQRVAFLIPSGEEPGVVEPDTAVSDANGRATARWTLGPALGTQTLEARVVLPDPPAEAIVMVHAAAEAADPDTLRAVSATSFIGIRRRAIPDSLVVRVADRFGNPVAGAEVRWRVESGGGSLATDQSATDADGRIAVEWTLGSAFGDQRVSASISGATGSPVVFRATAL